MVVSRTTLLLAAHFLLDVVLVHKLETITLFVASRMTLSCAVSNSSACVVGLAASCRCAGMCDVGQYQLDGSRRVCCVAFVLTLILWRR